MVSVMSTTSNSITINSVKGDSTQSCWAQQRSVRVSSCPFLVDKEALYHSHSLKFCTCARRWIREILARPVAASLSDLASASLCTTVRSFNRSALTCKIKRT